MKNFFRNLNNKVQQMDPDYIVMAFCAVIASAVGTMGASGML